MSKYQIGNPAWTEDYRRLMFGGAYKPSSTNPPKTTTYRPTVQQTPQKQTATPAKAAYEQAYAPQSYTQQGYQAQSRTSETSSNGKSPYLQMYQDMIERAEQAKNERISMLNQLEKRQTEQQQAITGEALRQAYIQNQQAEKALPQQMAAFGSTGGVTESSLMGLQASYGEGRIGLENSRAERLSDIKSQIGAQKSDVLAGYYDNIGNIQMQGALAEQQYKDKLAQQEYERQQEEREWQYKLAQDEQKQRLAQQKAALSQQKSANSNFDSQFDTKSIKAELKNPVVKNFIKVVNAKLPTGNVRDPRTGQVITPTDQIMMSVRENMNAGYLTESQALAILSNFGIAV